VCALDFVEGAPLTNFLNKDSFAHQACFEKQMKEAREQEELKKQLEQKTDETPET
jgi:hypothetical protein